MDRHHTTTIGLSSTITISFGVRIGGTIPEKVMQLYGNELPLLHTFNLPASAGAAARRGDDDDRAGEPIGVKMRKPEHCPAGGADDQGFGKVGERIAQ